MGVLYLPGDPGFDETLLTPRPDWRQKAEEDGDTYAFVVDESGMARPVNSWELQEYLEGGEYEQRLIQIDDLD